VSREQQREQRREERREQARAEIRRQVDDGELVVRHATPEELAALDRASAQRRGVVVDDWGWRW
jgi:hypothetical protein